MSLFFLEPGAPQFRSHYGEQEKESLKLAPAQYTFASWSYPRGDMLLIDQNGKGILDDLTSNIEWEVKSLNLKMINTTYACCPDAG